MRDPMDGHRCTPVARVPGTLLDPDRELWIGRLTEPLAEAPRETHCVHVRTPYKSVVFGVWQGDFDLLAALGHAAFGRAVTERWSRRVAETLKAAARPEPFQLWEQAKGDRDEYLRLMEEHGHIVEVEPCPDCGGVYRHRHDKGAIVKVDIFGHDLHDPPPEP